MLSVIRFVVRILIGLGKFHRIEVVEIDAD
jgi:hypothetical protein